MPVTEAAWRAFKERIDETSGSEFLFPSPKSTAERPYMSGLKKIWAATLQRAGVPHFSCMSCVTLLATRLSAGGAADHFVTQTLRQGDGGIFKLYSQAKLNMMPESLARLDRNANEHGESFGTAKLN